MRMMARMRFDTAMANAAVKSGSVEKTFAAFIEKAKPEAVYFTLDNGQRTGYFVFDMTQSSTMPSLFEDAFMTLGVDVQLTPVMNADELKAGFAAM